MKELVGTPGKGKVMVVVTAAPLSQNLIGRHAGGKSREKRLEGLIIYGCIRDVDAIMDMELGVQALGTVPMKTDKRDIGDVNVPVKFGGVEFIPVNLSMPTTTA